MFECEDGHLVRTVESDGNSAPDPMGGICSKDGCEKPAAIVHGR